MKITYSYNCIEIKYGVNKINQLNTFAVRI